MAIDREKIRSKIVATQVKAEHEEAPSVFALRLSLHYVSLFRMAQRLQKVVEQYPNTKGKQKYIDYAVGVILEAQRATFGKTIVD